MSTFVPWQFSGHEHKADLKCIFLVLFSTIYCYCLSASFADADRTQCTDAGLPTCNPIYAIYANMDLILSKQIWLKQTCKLAPKHKSVFNHRMNKKAERFKTDRAQFFRVEQSFILSQFYFFSFLFIFLAEKCLWRKKEDMIRKHKT